MTGFKKRKDERRKKAQEKAKVELKDKRKEIVAERKKVRISLKSHFYKKFWNNHNQI